MAPITIRQLFARILTMMLLTAVALPGSGCAVLDKCTAVLPVDTYESVDLIEMPFQPVVFHIDDTMNPGKMVPCIKGKVYLMHRQEVASGEDLAKPVVARGKLIAQIFDTTAQAQGVTPTKITDWQLEPTALRLVRSSDQIGVGYTLFLPFVEYTPAIKSVMLRIIYEDEKGNKCQNQTNLTLRMAEESPQLNMTRSFNVPATLLPRR